MTTPRVELEQRFDPESLRLIEGFFGKRFEPLVNGLVDPKKDVPGQTIPGIISNEKLGVLIVAKPVTQVVTTIEVVKLGSDGGRYLMINPESAIDKDGDSRCLTFKDNSQVVTIGGGEISQRRI